RHFDAVLTAYGRLKALADAGYLRSERVYYHKPAVYLATRGGATVAGTALAPAHASHGQLRHHLLVADVADCLLQGEIGARWLTGMSSALARRRRPRSAPPPVGADDPKLPVIRSEVPAYVLDFYVDDLGNIPARDWLRSLESRKRFAAGHAMQTQLQLDGLGV